MCDVGGYDARLVTIYYHISAIYSHRFTTHLYWLHDNIDLVSFPTNFSKYDSTIAPSSQQTQYWQVRSRPLYLTQAIPTILSLSLSFNIILLQASIQKHSYTSATFLLPILVALRLNSYQ